MKRIYVSEEVLLELRELKKSVNFDSDDSAIRYLLSHHKSQEQECLENPIVSYFTPIRMPESSTPMQRPGLRDHAPSVVPLSSTPARGMEPIRVFSSTM